MSTDQHRTAELILGDARLFFVSETLVRAVVRSGGGTSLVVNGATAPHPLFGVAHALLVNDIVVSYMGAVDFHRPQTIPPIEHPAVLPAGTGTALLNALAIQAERAGVSQLRYAGPYPTSALWNSLLQCFSTEAADDDFTRDASLRALSVNLTPVAVDFTPAPFLRTWVSPRVAVQRRANIERAIVDHVSYLRDSDGVHRLDSIDGELHARMWLGDRPWATRATFDANGQLLLGPIATPPVPPDMLGKQLPAQLLSALGSLIAEGVPAPLTSLVDEVLSESTVVWGDTADRLTLNTGTNVVVNAALWQQLAPLGMSRVALGLAEALTPVVARLAQARLAKLVTAPPRIFL